MTSSSTLRIVLYQGNLIYFPLLVKRFGSKTPEDLSIASAILLEWEDENGAEQVTVNVLSTLPGADWANGIVVLAFSPADFTATIGEYTFSLTVVIGGQTITYCTGTVEVHERPGFPSA